MYSGFLSLTDEAWEIDKSELTLTRELGSGQFGVRSREYLRVPEALVYALIIVLDNRASLS